MNFPKRCMEVESITELAIDMKLRRSERHHWEFGPRSTYERKC